MIRLQVNDTVMCKNGYAEYIEKQFWENFQNHVSHIVIRHEIPLIPGGWLARAFWRLQENTELCRYNSQLIRGKDGIDFLEFEHDRDATAFLLRWL